MAQDTSETPSISLLSAEALQENLHSNGLPRELSSATICAPVRGSTWLLPTACWLLPGTTCWLLSGTTCWICTRICPATLWHAARLLCTACIPRRLQWLRRWRWWHEYRHGCCWRWRCWTCRWLPGC